MKIEAERPVTLELFCDLWSKLGNYSGIVRAYYLEHPDAERIFIKLHMNIDELFYKMGKFMRRTDWG